MIHFYDLTRIDALAKQIFEEYTNTSPNESLYCLCVLKGGFRFFSDLTERLTNLNRVNNINCLKLNLDFIRLKSYVVRNVDLIIRLK